ncbi:SRPBCC family protein [Paenibacillus sp.]|uniref:SRPBCC family protein n=1 Tax=Paenibacillus sp. TaxID=58172 RepID=UPI002811CDC9|nr:SRPBCC family protein [Paenibacillus sp.]
MNVDVSTSIVIRRPREAVSAYAADPDNAPAWYANIDSAVWKTPKSLGIGSRIAFEAKFLGKPLAYIYEITEYVPGERLVMKTAEGPFPMETTYTWESVDGNATLMTLRNRGVPSGFSKLFAPMMSTLMRRANEKDLKKITAILESRSE